MNYNYYCTKIILLYTYGNNNYCNFIIDSTNSTEVKKDIFSSKNLPLVPYNYYNDHKIFASSSHLVKNDNISELNEYIEPELQRLLENNFESIENYNVNTNISNNE